MNKQQWTADLKDYVQTKRQENPIPPRESLTGEQEWEYYLTADEFIGWHKYQMPRLLAERSAADAYFGFDPEPVVVLLSHMPGLVAFQEILPQPHDNFVYLLEEEFNAWGNLHYDYGLRYAMTHWSYFTELAPSSLKTTQPFYPQVASQEFRLQNLGDMQGRRFGRGTDHLWHWNGKEMALLSRGFRTSRF
jgi:hypothetical protein